MKQFQQCKIGIVPVAKRNQYQGDVRRFLDTAKAVYETEGIELLMPKDILFDEDEILRQIKKHEDDGADMIMIVVGSWIFSSLVITAVNDLQTSFLLYGISDRIANGNLGVSLQIKYVLEEMGKKFLYLAGKIGEEENTRAVRQYARACAVKKAMRNKKIATIGGKCMMMYQTQVNEYDYKRVFGIDFPQYDTVQVFSEMERVDEEEARRVADDFLKQCNEVNWELDTGEKIAEDAILSQAKLYLAFRRFRDLYGVDMIANKCMPEMVSKVYGYNYGGCIATALLNDAGIMTACEADVPAGISMYILHLLTGRAVFFADIAKLNAEKNMLTFFNCGTAPLSMADRSRGVSLWPIPKLVADEAVPYEYFSADMKGACIHLDLETNRKITLLRVGGNAQTMRLHVCTGTTVPREVAEGEEQGIRWPGFGLQTEHDIGDFLNNVTGHHYAIAFGDWSNELRYLADVLGIGYLYND